MPHVTARAPGRIDFGGGWTDVPPYSEEQGGCVCNVAIARHCVVRLSPGRAPAPLAVASDGSLLQAALRRAGSPNLSVDLHTEFPVGAGLGGSSAAGVSLCGALATWRGEPIDRQMLAEKSRQLEVEDLGVAGGRQDHFAAAFGGALALSFGTETRVRRIALTPTVRAALERRCVVVYTGQSRISGDTIKAVLDAYRARQRGVIESLARMKRLAEEMCLALSAGDLDALGVLVAEHWTHQRSLHPAIPTPLIDTVLARASEAGALGGKALGASGGGCVIVITREDAVQRVRTIVEALAQPLPFTVDEQGFRATVEDE